MKAMVVRMYIAYAHLHKRAQESSSDANRVVDATYGGQLHLECYNEVGTSILAIVCSFPREVVRIYNRVSMRWGFAPAADLGSWKS